MNIFHKLFTVTTLSLVTFSAVAGGKGVWLDTKHNFGAFDENVGTVYCDFKLVNVGDEPLAIISARANCGCTRPEYSIDPVAPGDTTVIRVGFDPKGRPGRFVKYINVDLDCDPLRSSLSIQGTVIGASNTLKTRFPYSLGSMKLRSLTIPYGGVDKGHTPGQYLEGYNASADTLHPVVKNVPTYIKAIVQPADVPPGEQFVVSTIFESDKCDKWGVVTDSFELLPSANATEAAKIEIVAILSEDFSKLTPDQLRDAPIIETSTTAIDLEKIPRTDSPIYRKFTIENLGKSPLIIRAISCPDKAVTVKMKNDTIKPGKKETVEVTVVSSLVGKSNLLNARINIVANDPNHPTSMVRVVAEVK
ncbi:MAG: DUF1573 domain-containing protein [Duncaniella sp.]|nr:DUF1573 domain-containing protein [Muribaculum sp.]MCM1254851.1 DUF1573 domain-containing protein [Duncaniella sp.]